MQQHLRAVKHLADVQIERWPLDPLHEENRKPVAADEYSFRSVGEIGKVTDGRGSNMFLNRAVSLIAIAEVAAEATDRVVAAAVHRFQFVDVGKLSRGHERHSQSIDGGKRAAQEWMSEADRRALDGLSEIPRRWPVSRNDPGLCRRNNH